MKRLYTFLAASLLTCSIFAQSPQRMSYQAVIRDGNNLLVQNQNVSVRLSILQGSTSGSAVYVETQNPSTNGNGLISLEVGSGTLVSGNFSNIDWSNGPYFLRTETDPDGGSNYTIIGTSQLLSVPYAFHATTVENDRDDQTLTYNSTTGDLSISNGNSVNLPSGGGGGGDNWGSQVVQSDATMGGNGTALSPLTVNGDLTDDQTLSFNSSSGVLSISGGNNITLPVTTGGDNWGTQVVQSNSTMSGNGTSSSPLAVVGDLTDDQTLSLSGSNLSITGGNSISLAGISSGGWTVSGNNIYNPNTGNVGIGTTTPSSKLEVNSTLINNEPNGLDVTATGTGGSVAMSGIFSEYTGSNTLEGNAITGNSTNTGAGWSRGLFGNATGSTASNRGVQGSVVATGDFNVGVAGFVSGAGATGSQSLGLSGNATGNTSENVGVLGTTNGTGTFRNAGVRGVADGASAQNNWGVQGFADNSTNQNTGVIGNSDGNSTFGIGVLAGADGSGTNSYAMYAVDNSTSTNGFAGFFIGDVTVTRSLNVTGTVSKGGGTFRIDHPLDPENKYLVHSFVESPEMMNIYNGNVVTDANGFATVQMPDYFEAANKDFRYQLTVMGTFAQAIVAEKISGNTFVIQTSQPNVEVSWQVTGVRADKWSNANRVVAEEAKETPGTYQHPELYNADETQSVNAQHFEVTSTIQPLNAAEEAAQESATATTTETEER
ncbi:MAG: hypothetical protein ACFB10_05825 [Salibacteraceae bacterium]